MATQNRAPTSDEAASGTWSGSAGSRWLLVDDYPSTDVADLITGGTAAAVITFGFSGFSIPEGSTGISVQVRYADGEPANGSNNCGGRLKVGGSYFNAATHNPSGTAGTLREDSWATNPQTSAAWTVDQVNGVGGNALQAFGINSTDSNPTFNVRSIELQVTYTEPVLPVEGTSDQTLGAVTGSAAGAVDIGGTSSANPAAVTGSAAGVVEEPGVSGTSSATLGSVSGAAAGSVVVGGVAGGGPAAVGGSAAGSVVVGGTSAKTPAAATGSAAGTVEDPPAPPPDSGIIPMGVQPLRPGSPFR